MAHEDRVDGVYSNTYLSLTIHNKIETEKIGTTVRNIIGWKYVESLLRDKYNVGRKAVYINERRKAIQKSPVYIAKIANGLNCYGELAKLRKKMTA